MSSNSERQFIGTAPYFVVKNLLNSLDYYANVLGFEYPKLWGEPPTFAMPYREGFIFMLKEAEPDADIIPNRRQSGYWDAYVWVTDADALFNQMQVNGAMIEYEPEIMHNYGMKEFAVRDPDGYVIAFGEDVEAVGG